MNLDCYYYIESKPTTGGTEVEIGLSDLVYRNDLSQQRVVLLRRTQDLKTTEILGAQSVRNPDLVAFMFCNLLMWGSLKVGNHDM